MSKFLSIVSLSWEGGVGGLTPPCHGRATTFSTTRGVHEKFRVGQTHPVSQGPYFSFSTVHTPTVVQLQNLSWRLTMTKQGILGVDPAALKGVGHAPPKGRNTQNSNFWNMLYFSTKTSGHRVAKFDTLNRAGPWIHSINPLNTEGGKAHTAPCCKHCHVCIIQLPEFYNISEVDWQQPGVSHRTPCKGPWPCHRHHAVTTPGQDTHYSWQVLC